jgi:hypothetical protein
MDRSFRLKNPSGWFAAGREIECALKILPDPAFKLFIWLCLHADRSSGAARVTTFELASALGKTVAEIQDGLSELGRQGVCSHPRIGVILILDAFWPYERPVSIEADEDSERARYICEIKRVFLERYCVRSAFAAADQRLACELYRTRVPIADVERAILLGSLRKTAALLNNGGGTPITSLHYFVSLFDEVRKEISPEYWNYVAHKVASLERRLQTNR